MRFNRLFIFSFVFLFLAQTIWALAAQYCSHNSPDKENTIVLNDLGHLNSANYSNFFDSSKINQQNDFKKLNNLNNQNNQNRIFNSTENAHFGHHVLPHELSNDYLSDIQNNNKNTDQHHNQNIDLYSSDLPSDLIHANLDQNHAHCHLLAIIALEADSFKPVFANLQMIWTNLSVIHHPSFISNDVDRPKWLFA